MGFFSGLAAGFGEAQGQHNQKMLDFVNQKSSTMAQLYGHLADSIIQNGGDQNIAGEFLNRAKGWAQANPILDPKGYQQLIKGEKSGIHEIVDQAHQRTVSDYQNQQFGTPGAAPQPVQSPGQQPQPQNTASSPSGQPQTEQAQGGALLKPGMPTVRHYDEGMLAPQQQQVPQTQNSIPSVVQQSNNGLPPAIPPQNPINTGGGSPSLSIQDYVRSIVGPEPPVYGALGNETLEHKMWRDVYQKRLEGTVPTPAAMQSVINAPYMSAGFASPYLSFMGKETMANARLAGNGYKLVNGQVMPLDPSEYSMAAQLKMQKDAMATELNKAAIPLKQAMVQYYGTKTQAIPMEIKMRLQQMGLAMERLRLSELSTSARVFGTTPDGKPIPGSLVVDGQPVGSMWSKNVLPTTSSQTKSEVAIPVMQQTETLKQFAQANPDLFGRVQGNFMEWLAKGKNLTNDPREGELRASVISLASLMVPLHGFRSQKAAEEFMGRLSQGMSPEGFVRALDAFNSVGQNIYDNGMPSIFGGQGQVRPRMVVPKTSKPLTDPAIAQEYLRKAGGNRDKARTLAKADGWVF